MGQAVTANLSLRKLAVLTAIVEEYVSSGEPVSSQAVVRNAIGEIAGLSSATIRNLMADLSDDGLLEQPHTSAGRIPTASGFRVYVERIRSSQATLLEQSRVAIDQQLQGVGNTQNFLERTSRVLAALSSGVGIAFASARISDQLEHIYFSRLGSGRVMAVVVTRPGVVRDRMLTVSHDLTVADLEIAASYLNENFRGWTLDTIREELGVRIESERSEYHQLLARVNELWGQALPSGETVVQTVYVDGVANLVSSLADRDRLRAMMQALETKQRLIDLLNAYIDAQQKSVRVIFGLEEHAPGMEGLVLVAAPASVAGETRGALAVIGPQRMRYEQTMGAVSYVAHLFDRLLHTGGTTELP
jgi:heat-inducible transcriptional repressor